MQISPCWGPLQIILFHSKLNITIVSSFLLGITVIPLEKLKMIPLQNFEGKQSVLWEMHVKLVKCSNQGMSLYTCFWLLM